MFAGGGVKQKGWRSSDAVYQFAELSFVLFCVFNRGYEEIKRKRKKLQISPDELAHE